MADEDEVATTDVRGEVTVDDGVVDDNVICDGEVEIAIDDDDDVCEDDLSSDAFTSNTNVSTRVLGLLLVTVPRAVTRLRISLTEPIGS